MLANSIVANSSVFPLCWITSQFKMFANSTLTNFGIFPRWTSTNFFKKKFANTTVTYSWMFPCWITKPPNFFRKTLRSTKLYITSTVTGNRLAIIISHKVITTWYFAWLHFGLIYKSKFTWNYFEHTNIKGRKICSWIYKRVTENNAVIKETGQL